MASPAETKYLHPTPFLKSLLNNEIVVRLKWGMEYVGILVAFDERMNIHLRQCQEWIDGKPSDPMGDVLIRCNNILHIRPKPAEYPSKILPQPGQINEDDE